MNFSMKYIAGAILIAASITMMNAGVATARETAPRKNDKLIYGVHFSSTLGQSSSKLYEITDKMCKLISEVTGIEITLNKYASPVEVADAFVKNEIDAAGLFGGQVIQIIDSGIDVLPYVTYSLDDNIKYAACLWDRKDSGINEVSDIYGKTLVGREYDLPFPYLSLRDNLYQKGIDDPLWNVFKAFIYVPSDNSGFMAVADGDADMKWSSEDSRIPLKLFMPQTQVKLSAKFCSDPVLSNMMLVINKNTVADETYKLLKSEIGAVKTRFEELAKTDNDFKMASQYMKMLKIDFAMADDDFMEYEKQLYERAKKKGWMREAEFVVGKMKDAQRGQPIEVKPDMEYCESKCGAKNATCIVECLK